MTRSRSPLAVLILLLFAVGGFGIYYLDTTSTLTNQSQTISSLEHSFSSLIANPPVATTLTTTIVSSFISTQTVTIASTVALAQYLGLPWNSPTWFLGATSTVHGGPALVANLTQATVFDCASEAATANGCTREVNGYPVTVWYPYSPGQSQPWPSWPNCAFNQMRGGTNFPAYCVMLGPNDFVVAVPQPGPT